MQGIKPPLSWPILFGKKAGPPIDYFYPTPAAAGASVIITGSGFTPATSVKFNDVEATGFVVDSDNQITATLAAPIYGYIQVKVTAGGVGVSDNADDAMVDGSGDPLYDGSGDRLYGSRFAP